MSAGLDRLLRAYRPLYLRNTLIEGAVPPLVPAAHTAERPTRLSLLAWVALALPRRSRPLR